MSGNVKFRFLLAPIVLALLVVTSPVSWAGELEYAQEQVRQNPNDAGAHYHLGISYSEVGRDIEAIVAFKESIRINPNFSKAHYLLGLVYEKNKRFRSRLLALEAPGGHSRVQSCQYPPGGPWRPHAFGSLGGLGGHGGLGMFCLNR